MNNTLSNGLRILELLSGAAGSLSVKEVSEAMRIPMSHACRLLKTLKESGYVEQGEGTRKYSVSLKALQLSNACLRRLEIRGRLRPLLSRLAQTLAQPVLLFAPYNWRPIVVDVVYPGDTCFDIGLAIGALNPVHCTASGKLCAAFIPEDMLEEFLSGQKFDKRASGTITSRDEFIKELEDIRRQRFSTCENELAEGVNAAAAPVFDRGGAFTAVIGSWFAGRAGKSPEWSDFKRQISDTAAACSSVLGCKMDGILHMPESV